ncbi:MAG TPA: hypothetical protein PLD28_03425, partial [Candidatus Cloacimonas sp.]|nr:hypothetical protein [Candidatus Cloacimonas sp.]
GAYTTINITVSAFELKSVLPVICHTISFFSLSLNKVINNLIEKADFDLKPIADCLKPIADCLKPTADCFKLTG